MSTPKKPTPPKKPAQKREPTPAELLDLAEGCSPAQAVAAAMRTGNHDLVAATRKALGI